MYSAYKDEIYKIMEEMECPDDFSCYKTGFKNLCKARNFGIESILECLEEDPTICKFSLEYGHLFFCKCPLRAFIANRLNK
jgi:hypothetical protein